MYLSGNFKPLLMNSRAIIQVLTMKPAGPNSFVLFAPSKKLSYLHPLRNIELNHLPLVQRVYVQTYSNYFLASNISVYGTFNINPFGQSLGMVYPRVYTH